MDPVSKSRSFLSCLLFAGVVMSAAGCERKSDPPGVSREALARATSVPAATATPAPAPSPAPSTSATAKVETKDVEKPKREVANPEDVKIKRLVVTRAIEKHEPIATETFTAGDEPVFAFVELSNKSEEAATVIVTFESPGKKSAGHVKLEIPAHTTRWRTWAKTRFIRQGGTWAAVVRTPDGVELSRQSFDVEAAPEAAKPQV